MEVAVVVVPVSEADDVRGPVVDDEEVEEVDDVEDEEEEDEDEDDDEDDEDDEEDDDESEVEEAEEFEVLVVIVASLKQAQSVVATIQGRVSGLRRGLGLSASMV